MIALTVLATEEMRLLGNDIPRKHAPRQCSVHGLGREGVVNRASNDIVSERVLSHDLAGEKVAHVAVQPTRRRYGFVGRGIASARRVKSFIGEIEESLVLAVVHLGNVNGTAYTSATVDLAIASLGKA